MTSIKLLCMAQLFTICDLSAQEGWYFQNPVPTSSELRSVRFVDPDTGWAAGMYGTIIYTKDGGTTWKLLQAADADWISQVFFIDGRTGWAVGERETGNYCYGVAEHERVILKTTDGGAHWNVQSTHGSAYAGFGYFNTIFFASESIGWLAGGELLIGTNSTIVKTTDGGESWFAAGNTTRSISFLFFVDSLTGWAVGGWSSAYEVTILKTVDGGASWTAQSGGVNGVLGSVFFVDRNTGWTVGTDNIILKTTNGGMNWSRQPIGGTYCQLTSVCFTDEHIGFIAGWSIFLTTTDGGDNWVVERYPPHNALSVSFANQDFGWRVGFGGSIQRTTDGGATWEYQSKACTREDLVSVDFVNRLSGWALGPSCILHTSDGGSNWELQYTCSGTLNDLHFADTAAGWAVGQKLPSGFAVILHTSDGGRHWNEQPAANQKPLKAVHFLDRNAGWAVGDSGTIVFTVDGGAHWNQKQSGTRETLTSIDFVDQNHGWVAGEETILYTINGGADWLRPDLPPGGPVWCVDFVDTLNGWAAGGYSWPDAVSGANQRKISGSRGYVVRTSDGGKSWQLQHESRSIYTSVKFIDARVGWVTGGAVLYTEDGGSRWSNQNIPVGFTSSIDIIGAHDAWLVGGMGSIMHTSTGGFTFIQGGVEKQVPNSLVLQQNYPNPFNPATAVEFRIQPARHSGTRMAGGISEFVTLKVYDLLGREVAVLVNDNRQAGSYSVRFDASGLASGVYVYRLTAGEYAASRKMLLVK